VLRFELRQNIRSPANNLARHPRHLRHVNTETVVGAARSELAQEDDLIAVLLDGDVVILDAIKPISELVELVVVGGEERFGLRLPVAVEVLRASGP